ncbi:type II/IV secretion system protein [Candidatus Falkowbacteria bacterium]|jgi:type IV pilus assembly protein PilB|nr:type II/IV secretion system protein [Candidatus Falkowbacteria bacterium]MBT6573637.1 type II/IV secretion system protein [Candidatus Falkowbacteria bacterium]MBT7349155.1 type II/IV secretion system protein [Candidatus Falkowbacteria bacterium]MBT7500108.1 type II/IV secretion system protein [Candidatus Falkowbacteria bacterium]
MLRENQKNLLHFLVGKKAIREIQEQEVENVLKSANDKDLREILVKGGFVDAEVLAQAEAEFYNHPYVNLILEKLTAEVNDVLPRNLAEQHFVLCFSKHGTKLKLALAKPEDYDAREALDFWASSKGYTVEYYVCSLHAWQEKFQNYNVFGEDVASAVDQVEKEREEKKDEDDLSTDNIEEVIKRAPVAQIVSMIVKHAVESRASDIHIEPFEKSSRVRYRIDGILTTVLTVPAHVHDSIISRIKVLSNLKIDETRVPQDGRFKYKSGKHEFDLRVSVMPLSGKEKVTMRLLDVSSKALSLEQLGFSDNIIEIIHKALKQTFGMVLVTGPTGSGKSTTLFSLLSILNKEGVNITTLEDPIEYNVPGINQAQVRPEVKFTFASGLRSLMRQDPDIIMVGEIRDSETAEMSVHAALTGHLLFSTLHTNDSIGSVPRLVDMKVEPFLLASTLNLVIAQRLGRRICSKCKEKTPLPEETANKIRKELAKLPRRLLPKDINLEGELSGYKGKGCPACKNSGYSGRVVFSEVLPINEKMRSLIANNFPKAEVLKELAEIGVVSLLQDGIIKALQGSTALEEVFRVSKEVEEQE